ncbi:hypothetical protein EMCRGX_G014790 [Ephydatia muelleri]
MISDTLSESGSEEAVLLITVKKRGKKLLAKVPLTGRAQVEVIECQLDTAASCNAMSVQDYEKLGKPKFGNSRATLSMYDGTARKSLGVVRVDTESVCLAKAKLKLTMKQIMEEYSDVFTGIGCLPGKYNIETDPSILPVQN